MLRTDKVMLGAGIAIILLLVVSVAAFLAFGGSVKSDCVQYKTVYAHRLQTRIVTKPGGVVESKTEMVWGPVFECIER